MPPAPLQVTVLAGGAGTRFWPKGRRTRPKQVLALDGADPRSLLTATLERLAPLAAGRLTLVAPADLLPRLRRHVPEELEVRGLAEPRPRNTAAAVLLAAHAAAEADPDLPLLVVPADHHVEPPGRYRQALRAMASRARGAGTILTLGLAPTRPATGYGYLRLGEEVARAAVGPIHEVARYVEKPDRARAQRMAGDGRHLWNGGTFAFLPGRLLEEAARVLPDVAAPLAAAWDGGRSRRQARLARAFDAVPAISIDHGVMEKARGVETLHARLDWDDLGSWDAVGRHRPTDEAGNAVAGDATLVDARNCLVDAEAGHVALLGVEDLIVVRLRDTVLVARRGRAEQVREIVRRLEAEGREDLL